MSEYAFALDDTHYIFRLRTGKGEAESVRFYYADRAVMTPQTAICPAADGEIPDGSVF